MARGRMKYYQIFSGLISAILVSIVWFNQDKQNFKNLETSDNQPTSNLILAMSLSAYILVALYSMIFSLRRLNRPGVSVEVRKLFIYKHTIYVIVFIIIWTIQLSASYYHLFNPPSENSSGDDIIIVDYVSGISMFSTGIVLALVRLYEPFFWFLIKQYVCKCFGVVIDEDKEGIKA